MKPKVNLLAATSFDWKLLFQNEHSPTRGLDSSGYNFSDFAAYLAALKEFQSQKQENPIQTIRHPGRLANHLFFSILVQVDRDVIIELRELFDFDIITAESKDSTFIILSGTLARWKTAVADALHGDRSYDLRIIFDTIFHLFHKLGLGEIWSDYSKRNLGDKTFLLEYRP